MKFRGSLPRFWILMLGYAALLACLLAEQALLAGVLHLGARMGYVGFVATTLRELDRTVGHEKARAGEPFRRFRSQAARLMEFDAVSFVALTWMTRRTFGSDLPEGPLVGGGAILIAIGVGVKVWAARTIGDAGYFWRDFFAPPKRRSPSRSGPYRYFDDPMYTAGYLHAYGFAIAVASLPGLVAAAIDQALILVMNAYVEKPHFLRIYRKRTRAAP
jgi:protein-S-isoprenylcysteine O-methyltransferase Ste14